MLTVAATAIIIHRGDILGVSVLFIIAYLALAPVTTIGHAALNGRRPSVAGSLVMIVFLTVLVFLGLSVWEFSH